MKIRNCAFIVFLSACISSCDRAVDDSDDWENLDCDNLKTGTVTLDTEKVKSEINMLTTDLEPEGKESDQIGHEENLDLLIERLNTQCESESAELICYACILTCPPQSEILVTTDSAGTTIERVVDILTPGDDILYFVRMHDYDDNNERATTIHENDRQDLD